MSRTKLNPDAVNTLLVAEFDDTKTTGSTMESGATDLIDNINNCITMLREFSGSTAWYTKPADDSFQTTKANSQQVFAFRTNVLTDVTVTAAQNYEVLSVAGSEAPSVTASVGAVTTEGAVVAYYAGFPGHSLNEVAGPDALNPVNMCLIIDATTGDAITSSNGYEIKALIQSESNVDGHTFDDTNNRVQLSFVERNAAGTDLIATAAGDIATKTINYSYPRRLQYQNLPESVFLTAFFSDNVAAVDVTLSNAATNQSGDVTYPTKDINWVIPANDDHFQFEDGTNLIARFGLDGSGNGDVTLGSSGANSDVTVDGLNLDINVTNSVNILNGLQVDTGAAGTTINIGHTANQIDVAGNLLIDATAGSMTTNATDAANTIKTTSSGSVIVDGISGVEINSTNGALQIGNDADAQNINIGTGAAARTITVGNVTGATALDFNAGTGGVTIDAQGAGAIQIGNAADTGNIDIGTGASARSITVGNSTGATGIDFKVGSGEYLFQSTVDGVTTFMTWTTTGGSDGHSMEVFVGDTDPSAGGGVAAPLGSVLFRDNSGTAGEAWLKTGAADTAWEQIQTGAGDTTLQLAYENGNTITTDATEGDVTITGTEDLIISLSDLDVDTTASITLDADAASNFSVDGGNLSFATTTSGSILADGVDGVEINSSGGNLQIGNDADNGSINIGTGAAARAISIGNTTGATGVEYVAGTGGHDFNEGIAVDTTGGVAETIYIGLGGTVNGETGAANTIQPGTGGDLTVQGGAAASSSGNLTLATQNGGTTATDTAGDIAITGGNAGSGSGTEGADITITTGDGDGGGSGGDLVGTAGDGGVTGNGGDVVLNAGDSGATSGTAGAVNIQGGDAGAAATAGGNVVFQAGTGNTTGAGGTATLQGGTAGTTGAGGPVYVLSGGGGGSGNGAGGEVDITTGNGAGTGNGGPLDINTGTSGSGATGNGGAISIDTGASVATDGNGGTITIGTGDGNGTGDGGNFSMSLGDGADTGNGGYISMTAGGSGTSTGVAGTVSISGGTAGYSGCAGGGVTYQGGAGLGSGAGGAATLQGGLAGVTGVGGAAYVTGRDGGSTSGDGGAVYIASGLAASGTGGEIDLTAGTGTVAGGTVDINAGAGTTNGTGGNVLITAGAAAGTGAGGSASLYAGPSGTSVGVAGQALVSGGVGGYSGAAGGNATFQGGNGNASGSSAGGSATLQGGTAGATGNGGAVYVTGRSGGATSGNGGTITLAAGGAATGTGGSITGTCGLVSTSGTAGNVDFAAGSSSSGNAGNAALRAGTSISGGTGGVVILQPGGGPTANGRVQVIPSYANDDDDEYMRIVAGGFTTGNYPPNDGTAYEYVNIHTGNRDPNGLVTSVSGSIYLRGDAGNSTVYVNDSSGTSGNTWEELCKCGNITLDLAVDNQGTSAVTQTQNMPWNLANAAAIRWIMSDTSYVYFGGPTNGQTNLAKFTAATDADSVILGNSATGTAVTISAGTGNMDVAVASGNLSMGATSGNVAVTTTTSGNIQVDGADGVEINSSGGALRIGNDANAQDIDIGTAGARDITVGNETTGTTLTTESSGDTRTSSDKGSIVVWPKNVDPNANEAPGRIIFGATHNFLSNGTEGNLFQTFGTEYTTASGTTNGQVFVVSGSATTDTVAGAGFTAGVAATSDATVVTTGSATFSQYDIVLIADTSDATDSLNLGLYEVHSHVGTTLTVKGMLTGITAGAEFLAQQFATDSTTGATITKVTLSGIRSNASGQMQIFENASTTTGISYQDLGSAAAVALEVAWTNATGAGATLGASGFTGRITDTDTYLIETLTGNHTLIKLEAVAGADVVTIGASDSANQVDINAGTGGVLVDATGSSNFSVAGTTAGTLTTSIDAQNADTTAASAAVVDIQAYESGSTANATVATVNIEATSDSDNGVNTVNVQTTDTGTVNVATGANANTVNIGNTTGATALNFDAGTGGLTITNTGGDAKGSHENCRVVITNTNPTGSTAPGRDITEATYNFFSNGTEGDLFQTFGTEYTTASGTTNGQVFVVSGSATTDTVAGAGFTAGVSATSDATVVTTGSATFSQYDIVLISDSSDATDWRNLGLYEVHSHVGTTLTVKGMLTGITAGAEFLAQQFATDSTTGAAITKVTLSGIRSNASGQMQIFENASTTTGISYQDLGSGAAVTLQNAYVNGNTITTNATEGDLTFNGTEDFIVGGSVTVNFDTTDAIVLSADAASNFTVDGANLDLKTVTSGVVAVDGIDGVDINSSSGALQIGNDGDAQAINIGTGAAARTITVGNTTGATALDFNAGTGGITLDTTSGGAISVDAIGANINVTTTTSGSVDVDGEDGVTIDSNSGSIDIGADADAQAINVGTGAAARTITVGNATGATALDFNAGTGGITLDTTSGGAISVDAIGAAINITTTTSGAIDIDGEDGVTIDSNSGAINIGNDADAQAINVGTGAAARTITVGNATGATALDFNAGTGGITLDTTSGGVISIDAIGAAINVTTTTSGAIDVTAADGVNITAGNEAAAAGNDVNIDAGDGGGANDGGNIILEPGNHGTAGNAGYVSITGPNDEDEALLHLTSNGTEGEVAYIFVGSSDPTAGGGITAPAGSLFLRDTTGSGELWVNDSNGTGTSWTRLESAAGASLQSAYEAGNTITTNATEGNLTFQGTEDFVVGGSVTVSFDTTDAISFDADAASNFTVDGANLTLSTTTSGTVGVDGVDGVTIDGSAGTVTIDAGGGVLTIQDTNVGSNVVVTTINTATTTATGDITLTTGNNTNGTSGDVGDIILTGGASTSGQAGRVVVVPGDGATDGYFWIDSALPSTTQLQVLDNSAGSNGETINFFVRDRTPEAAITSNQGSLCLVRDATDSSNGKLYLKETGTGTNTGWAEILTSSDNPVTYDKTVGVTTGAISANTNVSGTTTPVNLDATLGDYSGVTFVTKVNVYVNGALQRNGADASANFDVYPGTDTSSGDLKFENALRSGDTIVMEIFSAL